jgi:hypothetical protein
MRSSKGRDKRQVKAAGNKEVKKQEILRSSKESVNSKSCKSEKGPLGRSGTTEISVRTEEKLGRKGIKKHLGRR